MGALRPSLWLGLPDVDVEEPHLSDLGAFRESKCVLDVDAEVLDRALDLRMVEQDLNGPQVPDRPQGDCSMTEEHASLPVISFANAAALERWLEAQPADSPGLWIRFAKASSGLASVTKAEAIDAALCHGWIDGQLDKYDGKHWLIRFTPRKARSKWSQVNRTRATELLEAGRMRLGGLAQVEAAKTDGRWDAAYAPASKAEVPADLQAALDQSSEAAAFFGTLTSANRYAILYRIGAVKRPETRARKIAAFIAMLERGETVHS
jgi:uncharacterized protein YdeI (YjbR/CyaY-like superfamily)